MLCAGVSLGYSQLCDQDIASIPVPQLQLQVSRCSRPHAWLCTAPPDVNHWCLLQGGYLLVWVINAKYKWTLDQMERWGYRCAAPAGWQEQASGQQV